MKINVGQCKESVLKINLNYDPKETGERIHYPIVRNINMENVNCSSSKYGVLIDALPDSCCVYDVNVTNCNFTNVKTGENKIDGLTKNIQFKNLKINGKTVTD